jgi:2-desacetyl-2-hydroxyethyl bacteriochlorophyllide A dehydrogenase
VFGVRERYAVLFGKGDVRLLEEEVPEPKGNEVLVRVGACDVCTGDLYAYLGYRVWFSTPTRFGHEPAGEVVAVGPNVSGVKPGDRVAALVASGYGCYADYFIAKGDAVAKLPDDLPFEYGIGEPLGAVVNGVRQAAPRAGDSVAVVGAGFMGTLLIQALSRMNLSSLVAVDVRDDRLRLAKEYGATATLNPSNPNFDSEVKELAPVGFDVVIEASGNPEGLLTAVKLVRRKGRVAIFSYYPHPVTVDVRDWDAKGIEVVMAVPARSDSYSNDLKVAVELLKRGVFDLRRLITHRWRLDQIKEAFEYASKKPKDYIKGVIMP